MAADADDDPVYFFYGTPIEDEAELDRKRPTARDAGAVRAQPVWAQTPVDDQGRKRFHGAFTGGFSAGYFNTVGSKEGWQPSTFKSSRDNRASAPAQSVEDFLDTDEKEERVKITLQVQPEYDTFGSSAAEVARAIAQQEAAARPSLIPGAMPDELLVPATASVGVRLLQKMGWRPGRGVGSAATSAAAGGGLTQAGVATAAGRSSKWGTVAGVSLDNTPIYVLEPKQDQHGLGFDPFAGAEDFRVSKRQRADQAQEALRAAAAAATGRQGLGTGAGRAGKPRGVAFGGVTDDSGMYGYMEDYVEDELPVPSRQALLTGKLGGFNYELGDSDDEGLGDDVAARPVPQRC